MRSDFGAVVQAGLLPNVATNELGYRWLAQVLYNGIYKGWKPLLQATRHEFRPKNPDEIDGVPVDSRVVRISQFGGFRDIAAKYWLLNASLAKEIPFSKKYFNALVPYVEYSGFFKDEAVFPDSHLITVGMQIHLGPVWLWLDLLTGIHWQTCSACGMVPTSTVPSPSSAPRIAPHISCPPTRSLKILGIG